MQAKRSWQIIFSSLAVIAIVIAFSAGYGLRSATATQGSSSGASSTNRAPQTIQVAIKGQAFDPKTIDVAIGDTVVWTNQDPIPHTVTSGTQPKGDGLFDSDILKAGATFKYTFQKAGAVSYFCSIHQGMVGEVHVGTGNTTSEGGHAATMPGMGNGNGSTASSSNDKLGKPVPAFTGAEGEQATADGQRIATFTTERTANGDVKVFHLTAQPTTWEVTKGHPQTVWAFNGTVPGPEIRVTEGDRVRIIVTNKLPITTTVHWHGQDVPFLMDGVSDLTEAPIKPGDSFTYEFNANPAGTHWYHSHGEDSGKQVGEGLYGAFLVTPKGGDGVVNGMKIDRDYTVILGDGPLSYNINGKSFPNTAILHVKTGEHIRIRIIDAGEDIHPMHLHGQSFLLVSKDGFPLADPERQDTVDVGPAQTRDIVFTANNPGLWLFHCHILAHVDGPDGMYGLTMLVKYDDFKVPVVSAHETEMYGINNQ